MYEKDSDTLAKLRKAMNYSLQYRDTKLFCRYLEQLIIHANLTLGLAQNSRRSSSELYHRIRNYKVTWLEVMEILKEADLKLNIEGELNESVK